MSISRRKFGKDFKSKVVLESIKERESLEVLAKRYELLPTQISTWKSLALSKFSSLFSNEAIVAKKDLVDVQTLYAQIWQLKVENDFLKKSCYDYPK